MESVSQRWTCVVEFFTLRLQSGFLPRWTSSPLRALKVLLHTKHLTPLDEGREGFLDEGPGICEGSIDKLSAPEHLGLDFRQVGCSGWTRRRLRKLFTQVFFNRVKSRGSIKTVQSKLKLLSEV